MHPYPRHPVRWGRSPELRQGFDGLAIAQRNGVAVAGMAVDDHAFAADHHFAHQVAVAAEDPAVGDVFAGGAGEAGRGGVEQDVVVDVVESGRLRAARSEEHTSELQSLMRNSYAVFCLKTK